MMGSIPLGKLNCDIPAGTVVGPNSTGELLVSWGPHPDGGTAFGYATNQAIAAAADRLAHPDSTGPASVAEHDLQGRAAQERAEQARQSRQLQALLSRMPAHLRRQLDRSARHAR